MEKRKKRLSEWQLKRYRPADEYTLPLSFAEELARFSTAVKPAELGLMVQDELEESTATTDVLELICAETGLTFDELRAPQFLLALSLITEHGGGVNGERLVVDIPPPTKRPKVALRTSDAWRAFGGEPNGIANMRVGEGVGGGIQRLTI